MDDKDINEIKGKCTGAYSEGESITLLLVPFDRLAENSPDKADMKKLTALYLYEQRQKRIALLQIQSTQK